MLPHPKETPTSTLPIPSSDQKPPTSPTAQSTKASDNHSTPTVTAATTPKTQPLAHSRASQLHARIANIRLEITETQRNLDLACHALESETQARHAPNQCVTDSTQGTGRVVSGGDGDVDVDVDVLGGSSEMREETVQRAKGLVEAHIRLLTRYNETRDCAMGLLGRIADAQGQRLNDVLVERGVEGGQC